MSRVKDGSLGFGSLDLIGFNFGGVFQLRLATDPDVSDDPRGQSGWTFVYDNEPDFDRIIRFNYPIAPRSFAANVGVFVTDTFIGGQRVNDSIIGHRVNLGSNSYFDGSNGADGHEPIKDFELHVGSTEEYLQCKSDIPPIGNGVHTVTSPLPMTFEAMLNSNSGITIK